MNKFNVNNVNGIIKKVFSCVMKATIKPLLLLIFIYFFYYAFPSLIKRTSFLNEAITVMKLILCAWLILNLLETLKSILLRSKFVTDSYTLNILLPIVGNTLKIAIFLFFINLVIPELNLSGWAKIISERIVRILLILVIAWLFYQLIDVFCKFIIKRYNADDINSIPARKLRTQILIIKRIFSILILTITAATIFMVFDSVRNIGMGLLTTAGVMSAIGAFASQQSLTRIFSGLQIAFTQTIRIGDTVIIDNEFGTIEEITLSYIIVKTWDLRRLILPANYFNDKGLQNLTRESSELLGTVFIYTDYTLPIDDIRKKFLELLEESSLWNKQVANLQITDIKENTMEIRALVSANNASDLWNLRCDVREKLIKYIVKYYPECLSKSRVIGNMILPSTQ